MLMAPLPEYRAWYALAEQCLGRTGDFDRVRWYWYDATEVPGGGRAITWAKQDKIAIARAALTYQPTITHEAAHHILQQDGHPAWVRTACAGVMDTLYWH